MNNQIIILIPAYEPEQIFLDLLKNIEKKKIPTIIVNDGSNSNCNEIFKQASKYAKIINHPTNLGKGEALKTGIKYIKDTFKEKYIIVTMDCDGQHTIEDALKLGNYAKEHLDELIIGKRIRNEKTPLRSKIGNSITRSFYRIVTGIDIYDTQTGLRAFSDNLVDLMLQIQGSKFEYEMNVLLTCSAKKIHITELEIETIYIDNNSKSHFRTIKDSFNIYKEIFKFLSSSKKKKRKE